MIQASAVSAATKPHQDLSEMTVGERYFVSISDCCVEADFEALLVDHDAEREIGIFSNGITLDGNRSGGWTAYPVNAKPGAPLTPG